MDQEMLTTIMRSKSQEGVVVAEAVVNKMQT